MSKKGYKQESQAKIKSYIEPYSPHGEDDCILVLFFSPPKVFFLIPRCPHQTGGKSACKCLHHEDEMTLSSCFHSLCRV